MDRLDMSLDDLAKAKKSERAPKPKVVKSAPKAGKPREQPKQQQQQQQQYQQPRGGGGGGGILSRVGVSSDAGTLVVFRNLKYEVTDRDIRELALTIGEIKRGNLVLGPGGRSSGAAEVVYVSRSDAIKAVKKFNGLTLDSRPMDVMLGEGSVAAPKSSVFGSALGGGGNPRFSVTLSDPVLSGGRGGGGGGGGGRNVVVKQQQSNKKPSNNNNNKNNGGGSKGGRDGQKQRSGGGDREKKPVSADDLDKQLEKFLASKKGTDA